MNNLFKLANKYAKNSTWVDFSLVKICVCAIGVLIGTHIPEKHKKPAIIVSVICFFITYVGLITRLLDMIGTEEQ